MQKRVIFYPNCINGLNMNEEREGKEESSLENEQ
jgi:hypothetical protein